MFFAVLATQMERIPFLKTVHDEIRLRLQDAHDAVKRGER